jgi:hypothetical protein
LNHTISYHSQQSNYHALLASSSLSISVCLLPWYSTLVHKPPFTFQQGSFSTITLIVRLRGTSINQRRDFGLAVSFWEAEKPHSLNAISGSLIFSIQSCNSIFTGHVVQFKGLISHQSEKYEPPIMLAASSLAVAIVTTRIDSDLIEAGRNIAVSPHRPATLH